MSYRKPKRYHASGLHEGGIQGREPGSKGCFYRYSLILDTSSANISVTYMMTPNSGYQVITRVDESNIKK